MNERQIIDMLLNKELEISSKIHQSINTILRYGYDEAKCKKNCLLDRNNTIYLRGH